MKYRIIALYLPQFHPIPENDEWWGKGFTEWTNVAKAKPSFRGHIQPRIPGDLGFYDLRLPEVRKAQAELAKEAGIEGFCYYHYWFGEGKQLLERPFNEVVRDKEPDFPFCLCWANHSWGSSTWTNVKGKTAKSLFVKQKYMGEEDNKRHFYTLLEAFKDKRYITVDGKILFLIYDPFNFEGINEFINQWRQLAIENGLKGFHFVGMTNSTSFKTYSQKGIKINEEEDVQQRINEVLAMGFDAVNTNSQYRAQISSCGLLRTALHSFIGKKLKIQRPLILKQDDINNHMLLKADSQENVYPTILPNWDRTPRNSREPLYVNSTPEVFRKLVSRTLNVIKNKSEEHRIVIVKSWNEWGEGNYMEPDLQYGRGYIEAMKSALLESE